MPEVKRSLKNAYFDIAGGPLLFPTRGIFNAALQLIDHRKIIYGSDYPLTRCWKNEFGFFSAIEE
jgi:predicted TIM-barrel fold metal-dependent hydrolase